MRFAFILVVLSVPAVSQQCPVKTVAADFTIDMSTSSVDPFDREGIRIMYRNDSDKVVKAVKFRAESVDKVGDKKEIEKDFVADKELKPGKKTNYQFRLRTIGPGLDLRYTDKADASAWPVKVLFKDNSVWEDDGKRSCR